MPGECLGHSLLRGTEHSLNNVVGKRRLDVGLSEFVDELI